MKVCICTPTVTRPFDPYLDSLVASAPVLDAAGIEHGAIYTIGNAYISFARAEMGKKALDWGADVVVFIDHDVSWAPRDLLRLIETEGDVVGGTYRFKTEPEEYMGALHTMADGRPVVRPDGCVKAITCPAGFLKITRSVFAEFADAYPELVFGDGAVDLFNHGAYKGTWWGEDYAFARRWQEAGGEVWIRPDLDIGHHSHDGAAFSGNFHRYLLACPGGSHARMEQAA